MEIYFFKKTKNSKTTRCFKPKNFGDALGLSLHHFSVASDIGYGQAS